MQYENDMQIDQKYLVKHSHQQSEAFSRLAEVPPLLKNQY